MATAGRVCVAEVEEMVRLVNKKRPVGAEPLNTPEFPPTSIGG